LSAPICTPQPAVLFKREQPAALNSFGSSQIINVCSNFGSARAGIRAV